MADLPTYSLTMYSAARTIFSLDLQFIASGNYIRFPGIEKKPPVPAKS